MPKRTRAEQDKYNEQRRVNKGKSRQALFISEYVQTRWFELYSEAVKFFNDLDAMYPIKYDLRKTSEFREWKKYTSGEILRGQKRTRFPYSDIENMLQTSTRTESPPQPQTSGEPESPPQAPISPESPPQPQTSGEPESPPQAPISPESPPQLQTSGEPESPPQAPISPESPPQPQTPTEPKSPLIEYNDTMQLMIPLLPYNRHQKSQPTVTTRTIEINTEEEIIEPSITFDDIPPDKVDQLINELRNDPDLKDIFRDIEEQIEFEELGMDIDIQEHDLLEDELFGW